MQYCEILPPKIAKLLPLLAQLNEQLSIRDQLPQIEVAVGEHVDVLVLRIMQALTPADEALLKQFADTHQVQFWTQTKGPETVTPFYPLDAPALTYSMPEFGVTMPYAPTEFTQVNSTMNRLMVSRALRLLNPQPDERIADFFCGLGNFTLPIARSGAQVLGIEGSAALVKRAGENAAYNALSGNAKFGEMNLFEMNEEALAKLGHFDKWLIDPPRDGALELVRLITPETAPQSIVYVSCNPATLARDADVLVHEKGYELKAAGVMNMFPHTSHVESIAVFVKADASRATKHSPL
jgi:23S rRNA (uracil1939-C5)-methyltransferase